VLVRILLPLALLLPATVSPRPTPAPADPTPIAVLDLGQLKKGLPKGWELKANEGKVDVVASPDEASNGRSWICVQGEEDERALELYCRKGSFSINRDITGLELDGHSVLEWEWKATALPEKADMRKSKRNDQALQVLVQLDTTAKRVISYVWDTSAPVGTKGSESYAMGLYKVKVLCVQSGSEGLGEWHKLRRDLRADYKELYGSDKFPGVAGIRIQSNSQYTKSVASGAVRSLVFHPAEEERAGER
jgi:hypothetical protein